MLKEPLDNNTKQYRVVSIVIFGIAFGIILARILVSLLPISNYMLVDTIFSLTVQIGVLLVMPFLVYKFVLKKNFKEVLMFSNVKKTKPVNIGLSLLLGFCVFVITIGVSAFWLSILMSMGYEPNSSSSDLPEKFNFGMFILSMTLTAILPGICEEFAFRGGFLSTMKKSFTFPKVLIIMAIAFGLFHCNVPQLLYTALFGAFMAFLTIKLKSIIPAMVVHFTNNGLNVYLEYAEKYGWFGYDFFDAIQATLEKNPLTIVIAYILIGAIAIAIVYLLLHLNANKKLKGKKEVILDSGFDHTNNRVVLVGDLNRDKIEDLGMVREVYGKTYQPEALFKPKLIDNAFYIGAIVITSLTTIFSFIWGVFF